MTRSSRFLRPFLALAALGWLGVLSLWPLLEVTLRRARELPEAAEVSRTVLTLLLLGQPALIVLAAVAVGVALAERAGLVSLVLRSLRRENGTPSPGGWGSTLALAGIVATLVAAVDLGLRRIAPGSYAAVPRLDDVSPEGRIMGLLYGGLTEELIMRFGLMTLLVWLGLRLTGGRWRSLVLAVAIPVAALAFAAAHLPALLASGTPDDVLVARTLALNGVLGVFYGILYASRSLEHAMLAHGATHVVFWSATPLLARLIS